MVEPQRNIARVALPCGATTPTLCALRCPPSSAPGGGGGQLGAAADHIQLEDAVGGCKTASETYRIYLPHQQGTDLQAIVFKSARQCAAFTPPRNTSQLTCCIPLSAPLLLCLQVVLAVISGEGLLYEYLLDGLTAPEGPRATLSNEVALLGSSRLGTGGPGGL
jgi:hypothetical protein